MPKLQNKIWIPVLVGALGYFVDIYDLVLFSILRIPSLQALGVPNAELLNVGVLLLNCQMGGMLIGGVLWGVLGDKQGRISVLFGSIFLYSAANILNSFVNSVSLYAVLRFIAGVGLAGELGAAITLVSETLSKENRGYGTSVVAAIGLSGAVVAGLTADLVSWRTAYLIGGLLGLVLLLLRIGVLESHLFASVKNDDKVRRGDLGMLLGSRERFFKYLACIVVGVPIWFVAGILMTFAPELGKELGTLTPLVASKSILYSYFGIALGDFFSGFLSQWMKSRKKIVTLFLLIELIFIYGLLFTRGLSDSNYYYICFLIGLAAGYWAVFVTIASEQFGTNLRATVTTSVPNFVRGSVVPMTLLFRFLGERTTLVTSALVVGTLAHLMALVAIRSLSETYAKDLGYVEI